MPDPKREETRMRVDPAGAEKPPSTTESKVAAAEPRAAATPTQVVVQGVPLQTSAGAPRNVETVPGGRYFVNGQWVDAHGKPRKEDEGLDEHGNPRAEPAE
jgi:hypothetical protein